ncbi:hypothetical protein D3C73_705860 [compost metagenome]
MAVDQRSDKIAICEGRADGDRLISLGETRNERIIYTVMHEEAAQCRAALASGAHGGESDTAQGQIEIGRRGDYRGIVAAEFEDRASETLSELRSDFAAHAGRAGGGNQRHLFMID